VLTRTLESHPAIAGLRETKAPENEGQHVQDVYAPAWRHGGLGCFAFDESAHLTEGSPGAGRGAGQRLWQCWSPFIQAGASIFVEKSPPNLIRTRFLQAAFPDAIFVLIVRHPAAVTIRTRVIRPSISVVRLLRHWIRAHDLMVEDLQYLRCSIVIRYEDFVENPRRELKRVADLLGVASRFDYSPVAPNMSEDAFRVWTSHHESLPGSVVRELQRGVQTHGYDLFALPGI
jgi:hypothetical protein